MSEGLFLIGWYLIGVLGVYLLIIRREETLRLSSILAWIFCSWLGGLALLFALIDIGMQWEDNLPSFKNPFYRKGK